MQDVATVALGGRRFQAFAKTMRFKGVDLTDASFRMEIRLAANTPGVPLVALGTVEEGQGIRFVGVEEVDGVDVSTIVIQIDKENVETLPYSGEPGDDTVLAYDLMVEPLSGIEQVWVAGDFVAQAGVTGATSAELPGTGTGGRRYRVIAGIPTFLVGDRVVEVEMGGPPGAAGSGVIPPQRFDGMTVDGQTRFPLTGPLLDNNGVAFADGLKFATLVVNNVPVDFSDYTYAGGDAPVEAFGDYEAVGVTPWYVVGTAGLQRGMTGGVQLAADRDALEVLESPTDGAVAFVTDDAQEWAFDNTDQSATVTADPDQIEAVAPASDATGASGAWKRIPNLNRRMKLFNLDDFGAIGNSNGTGTSGFDNSAALNRALAAMREAGGGTLRIPRGGTYRIAQQETLIDFNRAEIIADGDMYFSDDSTGFWGRIFVDGKQAPGDRIEGFSLEGLGHLYGVPDLHTNGQFIDGVYTNAYEPGGGPGYGGEDCILTLWAVSGFRVEGAKLSTSPNYVVCGRDIAEGTFKELRVSRGTAAIQCMDGTRSVSIDGCHGYDTSDDVFAFGYTGARNDDVSIVDCTAKRSGARGLVGFAQKNLTIARNVLEDTFLAGVLVECSNFDGDRLLGKLHVNDNKIKNAGMYRDSPFVRGVDVAAGIRITTGSGVIENAVITGNIIENSCNSHITVDGPGLVERLVLAKNIMNGIGEVVDPEDPIPGNGGQGGLSIAPPDGYYPGIKVYNAQHATVTGNIMRMAHEDGIVFSPVTIVAHLHNNSFSEINASLNSEEPFPTATAYISYAKNTYATANSLDDSPDTSVLYDVSNPLVPLTGNIVPRPTTIAADTFNRANVAPGSGVLGTTTTGSKTWTGTAGIISNQAYFGSDFDYAVIDAGQLNVDISVDIVVDNESGMGQRLIARAGPTAQDGPCIIAETTGNLFHWNGTSIVANAPFAVLTEGPHTLRLEVINNFAVLYVDGGIRAILESSFPTTQYVGFGDATNGLGRFDNFTAVTPLEGEVEEAGGGSKIFAMLNASIDLDTTGGGSSGYAVFISPKDATYDVTRYNQGDASGTSLYKGTPYSTASALTFSSNQLTVSLTTGEALTMLVGALHGSVQIAEQ